MYIPTEFYNVKCRALQREYHYRNAASILQGAVLATLHSLGWPVLDITQVFPKMAIRTPYPGYSYQVPYLILKEDYDSEALALIEARHVIKGSAVPSPNDYCPYPAAYLAVITDGQIWSFYSRSSAGNGAFCHVHTIDVAFDPISKAFADFERYLGMDAVKAAGK